MPKGEMALEGFLEKEALRKFVSAGFGSLWDRPHSGLQWRKGKVFSFLHCKAGKNTATEHSLLSKKGALCQWSREYLDR
jgi:hypothetical protein